MSLKVLIGGRLFYMFGWEFALRGARPVRRGVRRASAGEPEGRGGPVERETTATTNDLPATLCRSLANLRCVERAQKVAPKSIADDKLPSNLSSAIIWVYILAQELTHSFQIGLNLSIHD